MTTQERIAKLVELIDATTNKQERQRYILALDRLLAGQNVKGSLLRHTFDSSPEVGSDGDWVA
jgi:hypothetical protein